MSDGDLFQAIGFGQRERVEALLAAGVDPNLRDENGDTALAYALGVGEAGIAGVLLDRGADVDGGATGATPLQMALESSEVEFAERLLAAGADPNRRGENEEGTALHVLVRGYRDTASYAVLLDAGADPNARDAEGRTPLVALLADIAIEPEEELGPIRDVVEFLVARGADPAIPDETGLTAAALVESAIDDDPLPLLSRIRELLV